MEQSNRYIEDAYVSIFTTFASGCCRIAWDIVNIEGGHINCSGDPSSWEEEGQEEEEGRSHGPCYTPVGRQKVCSVQQIDTDRCVLHNMPAKLIPFWELWKRGNYGSDIRLEIYS